MIRILWRKLQVEEWEKAGEVNLLNDKGGE